MKTHYVKSVCIAALALTVTIGSISVLAPVHFRSVNEDVEMSDISGDMERPRRHFRLRRPSHLDAEDAEAIYRLVRVPLAGGYSRSGISIARTYQGWHRYNAAPFLSAAHGNHYVNVYANSVAKAYGSFEKAGILPIGSIIAKDSYSVTRTGEILLGPLFVMEKMPSGFNYVGGDWKFIHVQPDGTLLGETGGANAEGVRYCMTCHLAVERQDYLFFVPRVSRDSALRQ